MSSKELKKEGEVAELNQFVAKQCEMGWIVRRDPVSSLVVEALGIQPGEKVRTTACGRIDAQRYWINVEEVMLDAL